MATFVAEIEPQAVWRHFDEILTVPRASKNEARMREYVLAVAERHGLEHSTDAAGNVVVRKPASPGHEGAPITILQSHLDMVQEKNADVDFDFSRDAIRPELDGDYLTAAGTTLGSDNGIGVAAMLAVAEADDLVHGPLELLFTIDEETGLTGAAQLDASMLRGRRLINLDSEEEGALCVGCAGGADSVLTLPLVSAPVAAGSVALELKLHGFKGGHSGIDIHLQRGNAIQLLARAVYRASLDHPLRLAGLRGGTAHNAIPREAFATIITADGERDAVAQAIAAEVDAVRAEYRPAEPGAAFDSAAADAPAEAWDEATTAAVLGLVNALPHGVQAMSYDIAGLVETSTNLATVKPADGGLEIYMASRSSVASALAALRRKIRAVAGLAGAEVAEHGGYPGWQPDMDSELLAVVKQVHERELGSEPHVEAVHAGLECGLIGEMVPGMDMISFGPHIEFPHSPDERVRIASVGRFWQLLTATLAELA